MNKEKKAKEMDCPSWMTFKPGQIFPRAFRWLLNSTNHPEIHWWLVRLKTDYLNQVISLDIHDDIEGNVFNWLQALIKNGKEESVLLSHLNNVGDSMYIIDFKNLQILEHTTTYDYKIQGVLTHSLKISYKNCERQNNINTD